MKPRIFIPVPCFERKRVVELCLPTLGASMPQGVLDFIYLYNDGSREYDHFWLTNLLHDYRALGQWGTHEGIDLQRMRHFNTFWRYEEYTHIYLTDSDCIHDPNWREVGLALQAEHGGAPVCLFNSTAHVDMPGNTLDDKPESNVIWRHAAPGVSYLLTREHVRQIMPFVKTLWNWDWMVPKLLGNRFAVSRTSYVEHMGEGGLHDTMGTILAINPTAWLQSKRQEILGKLKPQCIPDSQPILSS